MGLRFRKSVNLGGGFRVNLSKSGVGYSWGVPGYRITKTAKGNTRKTYSIPGTGLSYVDEKGKGKGNQKYPSNDTSPQEIIMNDIESADIENYQPIEYQEFLNSIRKIIILNKISTWLCLTILFASYPFFGVTAIIGILLKVYVRSFGRINLDYKLDNYYIENYQNMIKAWNELNSSNKLWQIIQSGNVTNKKVHAGASTLINRIQCTIKSSKPFYLKSDIDMTQLNLKGESLIFMPDKILVVKGSKIGAINYGDIDINVDDVIFIEDEKVPKDAIIVGYTWQKVNKDGSPDKRYKENRQLPRCKYGTIEIRSKSGLNILLHCSNISNTNKFGDLFNDYIVSAS